MPILVTGATGFLGRPLVASLLSRGHAVTVLSRDADAARKALPGAQVHSWFSPDPVPPQALNGVDAVIHMAGESVGRWPWTADRKRRIRDSRVLGTRALVESLSRMEVKPRVLITASGVGYYGEGGDALLSEAHPPGGDFLSGVVREWEAEAFQAGARGIRTVALRMGIVLGPGGPLGKMLPLFRLGLGAVFGSGRQYMSWIHRDDAVGLFHFALEPVDTKENKPMGPINACAPGSVTNRAFSIALAHALRRPLLLRAPAFAIKAALGEMGEEVLLTGQRADASKALSLGYRFLHPTLEPALEDLLRKNVS